MRKKRITQNKQFALPIVVGDDLYIPPLVAEAKVSVGLIRRHLREGSISKVTAMTEYSQPRHPIAYVAGFETGEEFVLSARKNTECPIGRDGVLYLDQTKGASWVYHKSTEAFQKVLDTESSEAWDGYRESLYGNHSFPF